MSEQVRLLFWGGEDSLPVRRVGTGRAAQQVRKPRAPEPSALFLFSSRRSRRLSLEMSEGARPQVIRAGDGRTLSR